MLPTNQLTPEHSHMEDIGIHLINVESMQQAIGEQVRKLENNGDKTTVPELKPLLPMLAGLQSSLRKSFDAYARPLIRKFHIFNLPEELLLKIFEDVRGGSSSIRDDYSRTGIKDIKSIRLTCRRFCDSSSHLLIRRLDVSLTYDSLDHLDEVSRHPTISKGIRSLWIRAALFKPLTAAGLQGFIRQVFWVLREDQRNDLDAMRDYVDGLEPGYSLSDSDIVDRRDNKDMSQLTKDVDNRNDIMRSCTRYLQDEPIPRDEDPRLATLCEVYSQYSRLWNNQKRLLQNGTFVTSVAQAVARLPSRPSMYITDMFHPKLHTMPDGIFSGIYKNVRKMLLEPSSWAPEVTSMLPEQPVKLLYKLPNAIARAEHKLKVGEQQAKDLVRAAEHLKVLEIQCYLKVRAPEEQESLFNLVSLFSKGTNLRSVDFAFGHQPEGGGLSVGPLLALLPWAKLREISLLNVCIHCDELSELLEKLAPGTYIALDTVYLQSGHWADLLEVLRAKANCNSSVINVDSYEDSGLEAFESWRKFDLTWNTAPYPATKYIRGELLENPLQSDPAQNNADQDSMDQDDVDFTI